MNTFSWVFESFTVNEAPDQQFCIPLMFCFLSTIRVYLQK